MSFLETLVLRTGLGVKCVCVDVVLADTIANYSCLWSPFSYNFLGLDFHYNILLGKADLPSLCMKGTH